MGLCASSSSPSEAGGVIKRVLLLGPGGCGKSTVFKQAEMQLMGNEGGFTEDARRSWAVRMNSALLDLARILVHVATDNNPAALLDSPEAQTVLMQPADGTACPGTWEECLEVQGMVAATLKKSVQLMQEGERGKLESWISGLPDDAAVQFLLARHESFLRPDFTPDDSDILQFRYPTVATKVAKFTLPRRGKEASSGGGTGASIELTDVGGQRRERLKWKELGDRTDFVLFVASLDDYHRTLEEDATKNRLAEALTVFKMVVTKHMRGTPIILFLNKSDCFVESLAASDRPISAFFPTYKGARARSCW